MPIIIKIETVA